MQLTEEKNSILFMEDLAPERTNDELAAVFRRYDGFEEVRVIKARQKTVAFVTFRDIPAAENALKHCGEWNFPDSVKVSYAAK